MKFLIDRCAGHRLAEWLRSREHDVVESRERGPNPGDRILLEWAAKESRILVTMDMDFGQFLFVENARILDWFACQMCRRRSASN